METALKENTVSHLKSWYIVFISAIFGCSIATAFPQFSMTVDQLSLATGLSTQLLLSGDTVKSIAIVISMLISGFVFKRCGTRSILIFSIIATSLPQFCLPYITTPWIFFGFKFMQGLSSLIFPVFIIVIMETIQSKNIGLATAIFNGIFYSGGGIGGTITGYLIFKQDWISSYFAIGIIEIIVGLIWLFTVKPLRNNPPDPKLIKNQSNRARAISILSVIGSLQICLLIFAFFSTTFVIQAITIDIPLFSQYLNYTPMNTGKLATATTIGMLISCLISGKVSDLMTARAKNKAKARILALSIGTIILSLTSLLFVFVDLTSFVIFYTIVFFFSFGASWGLGTFYSILPELYNSDTLPLVTGFAGGMGNMGMPLAPLIVGVVFGVNGMWDIGWLICGLIGLLSLIACVVLYFSTGKKLS